MAVLWLAWIALTLSMIIELFSKNSRFRRGITKGSCLSGRGNRGPDELDSNEEVDVADNEFKRPSEPVDAVSKDSNRVKVSGEKYGHDRRRPRDVPRRGERRART